MAAYGSSTFAEAASRQGIAVAPDEVARYVESYRKLYPGKEVDPSKVERIVLAEKYLAAKGMGTGDEEVERAVAERWDPSRYATEAEADQARKAIRIQVLLGGEKARRESTKLEDLGQISRQERYKPAAMFEPIDLQVQGDPAECLAWSGRDCFVTLQEYNAACTQFRLPGRMDPDSAKSSILRRYALEKRRAELARGQGLDRNPDSIVGRVKEGRAGERWLKSAMRYGIPVHDFAQLQAAYNRYYSRYFAARRQANVAVIGSTDSAYIDSVHEAFAAWEKSTSSGNRKGTGKAREPRLPWAGFDADELPGDLQAAAEGLKVGQVSRPFRTPYGHFIVRLTHVARLGETPINKAYSQLTYLATRDKFLNMDSVVEAKARRFYGENQARYSLPDTMELRAWLIPGPGMPGAAKNGGKRAPPVLSDTAIFKSVMAYSLTLPAEIRIRLQEAARKDSLKTFLGPFPDRYGRWYFKVLSRRPARRVMPYHLVRKDIVERISAPLKDPDPGSVSEEAVGEVQLIIGLSEAYQREELRKSTSMRTDGNGAPDPDASPRTEVPSRGDGAVDIARETARMQKELAKYRREEEMLLGNTRMNLSALFRTARAP